VRDSTPGSDSSLSMIFVVPITVTFALVVGVVWLIAPARRCSRAAYAILLLCLAAVFLHWKLDDSQSQWGRLEFGGLLCAAAALLLLAAPRPKALCSLLNDVARVRVVVAFGLMTCVIARVAPTGLGRLSEVLAPYNFVLAAGFLALECRRESPLSNAFGLLAVVVFSLTGLLAGSGGDKGPLALVVLVWLILLFDPRVSIRRKCVVAVAAAIFGIPVATTGLSVRGFESVDDWYETRVVKNPDAPNNYLIGGMFSDGGRVSVWQLSLENLAASPMTGAPLGHMRDEVEHDEHNGLVFAASRTGLAGLVWFVLYLPLAWVSLKSIRPGAGNVIPALICGVPATVYLMWGDFLSGPFWVVLIACVAYCALAEPECERQVV
jgi:hypothetical protein